MNEAELRDRRQILHEAFLAGWQAALAMRVTNPRVLAVIESCFDLWLREAGDESDVLGLVFRGREDLPASHSASSWAGAAFAEPLSDLGRADGRNGAASGQPRS